MTESTERYVQCCKCKWTGPESEQAMRESPSLRSLGVKGWDHICPECGHDEFYELNRNHTGTAGQGDTAEECGAQGKQ